MTQARPDRSPSAIPDNNAAVSARALSRKWLSRVFIILMGVAAVYACATAWLAGANWIRVIHAITLDDVVVVVGLVTVSVVIRAVRWNYYVHTMRWNVPLFYSLVVFVASFALTATPGKVGELIKGALLRERYGTSLSEVAGVLLIERLGDLLAVTVIAASGLMFFIDLWNYLLASAVLITITALILSNQGIWRALLQRLGWSPTVRRLAAKLIKMLEVVRLLLHPAPVLIGFILAIFAWSCEAYALHLLATRLGVASAAATSFSIYGLATLAGAFSMLPGGIGGVEVVMALLLTRIGAPAAVASIIVVVFRLCTLWLFSLIGAIFLLGCTTFLAKRNSSRSYAEVR